MGGVIEGSAYIAAIATYIAQKNREEGHAEGLNQGRSGAARAWSKTSSKGIPRAWSTAWSEGIAEAYADANAKNAAYFRRMKEALERGEDFDEPPPTFEDKPE